MMPNVFSSNLTILRSDAAVYENDKGNEIESNEGYKKHKGYFIDRLIVLIVAYFYDIFIISTLSLLKGNGCQNSTEQD